MSETWIGAPLTFWWSEDCDERSDSPGGSCEPGGHRTTESKSRNAAKQSPVYRLTGVIPKETQS